MRRKYILNVKEDNALYEGVVLPSDKPPITRKKQINLNILKDKIKNLLSSLILEFDRKFGRRNMILLLADTLSQLFLRNLLSHIKLIALGITWQNDT